MLIITHAVTLIHNQGLLIFHTKTIYMIKKKTSFQALSKTKHGSSSQINQRRLVYSNTRYSSIRQPSPILVRAQVDDIYLVDYAGGV